MSKPYGWTEVTPRPYDRFKYGLGDLVSYCEATFQDRRWGYDGYGYFFFRNPADALMFTLKWS